jgi:hypothetical protein
MGCRSGRTRLRIGISSERCAEAHLSAEFHVRGSVIHRHVLLRAALLASFSLPALCAGAQNASDGVSLVASNMPELASSAVAAPVGVSSSAAVDAASALPDAPGEQSTPAQQQTDPHAVHAGQAGHTESGEPQQTKRVLGIMPNFSSVSANEKLPPMSAKDKLVLAARNSFDYSSFLLAGVQSALSYNSGSYPEFGEGAVGYGRYYWHTLADTADENFTVSGVMPIIFRQDPRFYTLGHGGFGHRAFYAATRIFETRSDNGSLEPNYSEIIGAGAAAGISSLYYPTRYRTWTKVGQKWLTSCLIDGASFTFKEFWPDINHRVFHTH